MAITYLTGGNNSATAASTKVITYTATAGAFAVLCFYARTASGTITGVTDTLGTVWQIYSSIVGTQGYSVWFATHKVSGSVTVTAVLNASISAAMVIGIYSGSNLRLTKLSAATGASTTPDAGAVVTNFRNDDLLINWMGINTNTPVITDPAAPGTWTQRASTGNVKSRFCDSNISSVGSFDPHSTLNVSETWIAVTVAVQEMDNPYIGLT
jgi:hypothetical protein